MKGKNRKRHAIVFLVIAWNAILIACLVYTVFQAFRSAEAASFEQNIDNVRTLTNASANKMELELRHHTHELQTAADYINQYHGTGMTTDEAYAYFETLYNSQEDLACWQLVEQERNEQIGAANGFDAVLLGKGDHTAFSYRAQVYSELAPIFCAASRDNIGEYYFTNEFTDPSPRLNKAYAIATTVRFSHPGQADTYQTLMLLIRSDYINTLLSNNNEVDSLEFFNYSNIIIDNGGNYVISSDYFQGTNMFDYLELYNSTFTPETAKEIKAQLAQEDYTGVFYALNHRGQQCAYTIVPVQNSDWHILSIVPLESFHNVRNFNGSFVNFAVFFGLLFLMDIIFVLGINRRLRNKTREAEAANSSKSIFLSSMSHDIRTPMNAIIGMTAIADQELEKDPPDPAALRECIRSIGLSGNHLLMLINDILDISKIESGKIVLHPSEFSIADAVSGVIELCQAKLMEKDLVFAVHLQDITHERLTGDPLRINQIFINILSNAIKYTEPHGKIRMQLTERPTADPGCREYLYSVSDTGIGMSEEFVSTIFDRFTRAVDTRINAVQGTGLGMAIVKQLVDMMGGNVHVTSELNVGSTFTVSLTLPITANDPAITQTLPDSILLVAEDPTLRNALTTALEPLSTTVDAASSAEAGLEMALSRDRAQSPYSLIVMDWNLEHMSAPDAIQTLRKELGTTPHILVVTALLVSEMERLASEAGADAFVTPPLFRSKLIAALDHAVNGPEEPQKPESLSFPDLRVLVAEDNDINWKVFDQILRHYGIVCERAVNGQCAVAAIKTAPVPYDIVFMDIQMPLMNGYQATRAIRALENPAKANTPIYAMTADTFADDVEKCKQAGMNGHLSKPIMIDKVIRVLQQTDAKRHPHPSRKA